MTHTYNEKKKHYNKSVETQNLHTQKSPKKKKRKRANTKKRTIRNVTELTPSIQRYK